MKVRTHVHVRSADGAKTAALRPGDTVPDWAEVTHPDAVEADAVEAEEGPQAPEPAAALETPPAPATESPQGPPAPAEPARKPAARKPATKAAKADEPPAK